MTYMNTLTIELICLLFATFLGAGVVKGVAGMGLPTVAMGLLGAVMSPLTAAGILIIPSFVTNVWQMLVGPNKLRLMRRLWVMMLCIVISTVLGTRLLVVVDPVWSGRTLGIALIAYAAYALFSPAISIPERVEPWLSPIIGIVTGAVTGATGVFVIPAAPYLQSLGLQKDELVQALGLSFTVSTVALAGGLLAHGAFRLEQLGPSLLAVIPALAGMWLGSIVRQRISPKTFRRCFLLFLIILGLELSLRTSSPQTAVVKPAFNLSAPIGISVLSEQSGTYHGLVIPTFMDLPGLPFQYSLTVEGEYVVKMRLDPAKVSPAALLAHDPPKSSITLLRA